MNILRRYTKKLIYEVSLMNASLYFDSKNSKYLGGGIFSFNTERRFLNEFNLLFSLIDPSKYITEEKYKLYIYNKAYNELPAMYEGIRTGIIGGNQDVLKYLFAEYKEEYGEEFMKIEDLKIIQNQIEHYRTKYEGLKEVQPKKDQKFDFEKMIVGIEQSLAITINRQLKVFQLKPYYENAIEQSRKNNK